MTSDELQATFNNDFKYAFECLTRTYNEYTTIAQSNNTKNLVYCPDFSIPPSPIELNENLRKEQNLKMKSEFAQRTLGEIKDEDARELILKEASFNRANIDAIDAKEAEAKQNEWLQLKQKNEQEYDIFVTHFCEIRAIENQKAEYSINQAAMKYKTSISEGIEKLKYDTSELLPKLKAKTVKPEEFSVTKASLNVYLQEPMQVNGYK